MSDQTQQSEAAQDAAAALRELLAVQMAANRGRMIRKAQKNRPNGK